MSLGAGKTVAVLRMVNGFMEVDLPPDPSVHEGSTSFTEVLRSEEAAAVVAALPVEARGRVHQLVAQHADEMEDQRDALDRDLKDWRDRQVAAVELAGKLNLLRAQRGPGS